MSWNMTSNWAVLGYFVACREPGTAFLLRLDKTEQCCSLNFAPLLPQSVNPARWKERRKKARTRGEQEEGEKKLLNHRDEKAKASLLQPCRASGALCSCTRPKVVVRRSETVSLSLSVSSVRLGAETNKHHHHQYVTCRRVVSCRW